MDNKLAVNGGKKTLEKIFPWPLVTAEEVEVVSKVVESGEWGVNSTVINHVEDFEKEFAIYHKVKYALSVSNGSVALRIALLSMGVKPGDEILVPALTFIATASIVIEANCIPVFVDVEPNTYNIDPELLSAKVTAKTKGIIPVHFAGHACDMEKINSFAEAHNLFVIEDACHAHGGSYKNQKLGTLGDVGCFSFQASKNMCSGEGGIIITDDPEIYKIAYALKNVGRKSDGKWYEHYYLGCNYRITQFQAAILRLQLKRLDAQNQLREENAALLIELLSNDLGLHPLLPEQYVTQHAYHLFVMKYDKHAFSNMTKEDFCEMLTAEGIPSAAGYPMPLYKQPVFRNKEFMSYSLPVELNYETVHCPETEKACYEECIWITQNFLLGNKEDMEAVRRAVLKIKENVNKSS